MRPQSFSWSVCVYCIYEKSRILVSLYIEYPNCPTLWHIYSDDFAIIFKILLFFHLYHDFCLVKNIFWE